MSVSLARGGLISSFPAGDGGWQLGTLAVGNLDDDPELEIVVPYRNSAGQWLLDAFKADGRRLPGFPYIGDGPINVSPTLYDLDHDGRDEIIFTCGARVVVLRGDGSTVWSTAITTTNYIPDGGFMAVTNGFYWWPGGMFLSNLPPTAVFSSEVSSPLVADVAGTGHLEVITAWKIKPDNTGSGQDYNPFISPIWGSGEWGTMGETWSGGVVFLDAQSGAKDYIYHFCQLVESGLALGRPALAAPLNTYVLNDSDSVVCLDRTGPYGFFGKGNLHGQFGKNQRLMSGSYLIGVDVFTADLDGDGLDEVLVPATQLGTHWQASETILEDDGAILWRRWKDNADAPLDQWQNNACMIPINPDQDNHIDVLSFTQGYEIAFRSWNGVELADRPGWPKSFYPYLPTPPVVGDVDGDGQEEIVIGTYNPVDPTSAGALQVFALDGTLKASVTVPGGLKHIPTLANVDGRGLEVIFRSLAGTVYLYSFGSTNSGPVSWATHRANAQRNGNVGHALFPDGTPLIRHRESGYRRASFAWSAAPSSAPDLWRIYRAEQPEGPFNLIATMVPAYTNYTDYLLKPGCLYLYEVAAVKDGREVHSAPFSVLAGLGGNLIANGGFEENDNSHWDKWFTGDVPMTDMTAVSEQAHQGNKSMRITFSNQGSGGSIAQYDQYGIPDSFLPVTSGQLYSFGGFFKSGGLSQPSEHWLEWASTKTAENTNSRPSRPYPLYFTPHFVVGTAETGWTYANRTFVLPPGFPNVELGHRYSVTGSLAGTLYLDDVFFRQLPPPDSTNWTTLIPFGSSWQFAQDRLSVKWYTTDYEDSRWQLGRAKFGAGGGPTNVVTALVPRQPLYYFRRNFVVPPSTWEDLLLSATCTRGGSQSLEIYLNEGRLMTTGIEAVSDQGNEIQYYDLTPFLDRLRPGTNSIAVLVHNAWTGDWNDVAFDLALKAMAYTPSVPGFSRLNTAPGLTQSAPEAHLAITGPPGSVWRVESAATLPSPSWRMIGAVTNSSAGDVSLPTLPLPLPALPFGSSTRFYRLRPY